MVTKKDETPDVADEAEGQPTVEVEEDADVEVDEAIEVKPEGNRISLRRGAAYRLRTRTRRLTAGGRASTSGPGSDDGHDRPRAVAGDRAGDRGGISSRDARSGVGRTRRCRSGKLRGKTRLRRA
jgi:hypothetical protein